MARERTPEGELIYYPRADVEPDLDGEKLLLTLRGSDGGTIIERFETGDLARRCGAGWVIRNPRRLHPEVEALMESWSEDDWQRSTGYVRRTDEKIWIQLRVGETVREDTELEHFDFARRFSSSWLDKPFWR